MPSILFVCTANQFRSPLAAAWFQKRLEEQGLVSACSVGSAGTWAAPGRTVIPSVRWMAENFGLDLAAHRSQRVERDLLSRFDLVLVMEASHREGLVVEFPQYSEHIFLLAQVAAGLAYDVPDPGVVPDETFLDIAREVTSLLDKGFQNIYQKALQLSKSK